MKETTIGISQVGASVLASVVEATGRRPRAAMLVVMWGDETEVDLQLPNDSESAVKALRVMRETAREAIDCLLNPKRHDA